ncbi:hypothetical protein FOG51_01283 [Hanseniaspora uvarum]|jgi:ribosomal protein S17|nr:hypothetical protein FOG51_01283 [Hanseniaspora uvarum]KAF0275762.1 hypothetical protein FOG50_03388 [Hanseniaspora uvarum]KKA02496.1 37S ribosomal protein S17, mitochondrial [Hanseniaspora uvarum DSM 2768]GMM42699.1 hypothetical protein DAHU10_036090 [Hanseniaspora uvarum]
MSSIIHKTRVPQHLIPFKVGTVLSSNPLTKTIIVSVEKQHTFQQIGKTIIKHISMAAHDENLKAKVGDIVRVGNFKKTIDPQNYKKKYTLMEILDTKAERNAELLSRQREKIAKFEEEKLEELNKDRLKRNKEIETNNYRDVALFKDVYLLNSNNQVSNEVLEEIAQRHEVTYNNDTQKSLLVKLLDFERYSTLNNKLENAERHFFIMKAIKNIHTNKLPKLVEYDTFIVKSFDEQKQTLHELTKSMTLDELKIQLE